MAKEVIKGLEVGILVDKDFPDFKFYTNAFVGQPTEYGFYNENNILYRESEGFNEAITYAREYVSKGNEGTYAILTNSGYVEFDEKDFDDGDISLFSFDYKDIEFSIAKINGEIIEGFVGSDNAGYGKYLVGNMKKGYTIRAFEEESEDNIYKVMAPFSVDIETVIDTFKKGAKYVKNSDNYSWGFKEEQIEELDDLREKDFAKFVELGISAYDQHFEKMLEVEECHRLEIFEFYIKECKGWDIENITNSYDFEFEW